MSNVVQFPDRSADDDIVSYDADDAELSVTATEAGDISFLVGNGRVQCVAVVPIEVAEKFQVGIAKMIAMARGIDPNGAA